MKVKGQSQPESAADIRLCISLHGSGSTVVKPGFECDSDASCAVFIFPFIEGGAKVVLSWQGGRVGETQLSL